LSHSGLFFIQNINSFWEYNHQKVLKIFILNILSIISNWTRNNGTGFANKPTN